jgi:hypothetical protein
MVKNQKLAKNILTPTTKAADHDVPVTPDEVWCSVFPFAACYCVMTAIELDLQLKWIKTENVGFWCKGDSRRVIEISILVKTKIYL